MVALVPSAMVSVDHVMWLGFTVPPDETQRMSAEPGPHEAFVHVSAAPTTEMLNVPLVTCTAELPVSPRLHVRMPCHVTRARLGTMVSFTEKVTFPVAEHWTVPAPNTVTLAEAGPPDTTTAPMARPVTTVTIATRRENAP